ncbi:MAG TPA: pilus assembly PilX N-terminal domain-containing protein [Vicinamibacterales bacterium]|nr:pilus assembly PilX N-terminal domain-containing protein [Vicinamibacterales bacterium]
MRTDRGIALITTLLVLMLMSALLVGFTTIVMSDQRYRFIDHDRNQAFYGASGGVEKLTVDLGNLFLDNVAPTNAQVTALTDTAHKPTITGVTFTNPNAPTALPASLLTPYHCSAGGKTIPTVGSSGYTIMFCANASGTPTTTDDPTTIKTGPYEGLVALQTPYQLDVTAKTATGGEVHLSRTLEAVAIPVFQFGMFSDQDLSFFAAENFTFGGRIHTNGNLFLAEGFGQTLQTSGKVTAVKDVVRQQLSNGVSIDDVGMIGTVSMASSSTSFRTLARTEGSVQAGPGSAPTANWQTISLTYYNSYLKNSATGAKKLTLPLVAPSVGGTNADLVRRPAAGEDPLSVLYGERLFAKASLRILLSDTAADITNIPGVTNTAPVNLDGDWLGAPPNNGTPYGPVDATHPPIARALGSTGTLATTSANTAAGATTISVNAVPAMFLKPQIWVKDAGTNTYKVGPFTCTTWNYNQLTGCNENTINLTAGWTIYISTGGVSTTTAPGNMPGNVNPIATIGANVTKGASITIPLTAGQTTFGFAANTFFINDVGAGGNGVSTLVTCEGATATQFTNCSGVPATRTGATITTGYVTPQNTGTIGGYIKIEKADAAGTWTDVTMEVLNYGIGGPNLATGAAACGDPTPNAIIRLQRLRDDANGSAACTIGDVTNSYEWWPNALYDTREAVQRDADPGTFNNGVNSGLRIAGVMYYVSLDAKNLAKWFKGAGAPYAAGTGTAARIDNTGYTVYFSDRRSNRNATNVETGEWGWEDFVNPGVANGAPNNACDAGEDVNGSGACETYGGVPSWNGAYNSVGPSTAPLTTAATPVTLIKRGVAQVNRPIFFRRALKLVHGGTLGSDAVVANRIGGLTVASENPVYIEGDWNATATFLPADLHAATSVIADAVTILSNNWNDNNSFTSPYVGSGRLRATQSYYRVAILAGKGPSFSKPSDVAGASVFGTDGGAHNFLRMLEGDNGVQTTVNFRGSMATLYYNRQAVGTFKCCSGTAQDGIVYSVPVRNFNFDADFTNPALLPPNTPMFRDLNAVGFSQELRPGR